jgi:hypothetical protein
MSDQLTLFAGDTPASHSPQPGSAQARKMTATSGQNLVGSWTNCGPLGSLERMLLGTSQWASMTCLLTWKAKVTPAGRSLFQLAASVPRTSASGSGHWPTATTAPGRPCEGNVRILRAKVMAGEISEAEGTQMLNGKSPFKAQGKIPAMLPTPTATMSKGSSPAALTRKSGRSRKRDRLDHFAQATEGSGSLNPAWVEAMMGFPPGWTDLGSEE